MSYFRELQPTLNTQSDSIRAKLFVLKFPDCHFNYLSSYLHNCIHIYIQELTPNISLNNDIRRCCHVVYYFC